MDDKRYDFSDALQMLKDGKVVKRLGWNSTDQFLYHVPAAEYPAMTASARVAFDTADRPAGVHIMVPYQAYIAFKTSHGTVVPWTASQTDLLAEDWIEADPRTVAN